MASYAWVEADLKCPNCGSVVETLLDLLWGGVMSKNPAWGPTYRVGSRILWFVDSLAKPPVDAVWYKEVDPSYRRKLRDRPNSHDHPDPNAAFYRSSTNVGDPKLMDLDVFTAMGPYRCRECRHEIQGGRISIRDGFVESISAVAMGEVDRNLTAVAINPKTGEVVEEIYDAPLSSMTGPPPWSTRET